LRVIVAFVAFVLALPVVGRSTDEVSLGDVADRALEQSRLMVTGSKPFHMKVEVVETTHPGSEYQAKIEEYWVSRGKWRRTIQSPKFSQTLVVNGDSVSEQNTGDYFPFWLSNFVTALEDPFPSRMLEAIKRADVKIMKPSGSTGGQMCSNLPARVDRWVICFDSKNGLLSSIFTKGYGAEFKEYKRFGDKHVARLISDDPEPGMHLEARIVELADLSSPDDSMFEVSQATPAAERIASVHVSEETFRSMALTNTEIDWPPTGGGLETGGCAVYASTDRTGQVREVWPEGCDSTGLEKPLRDAVKQWRLKPAIANGAPVQIEALLGFTFHTKVSANPPPELTDEEVRKLAKGVSEPVFPPGTERGAEYVVRISVDENGKVTGVDNPNKLPGPIFMAIYRAVSTWKFRPYVKGEKSQYFHGDLAFRVR